MIEFIRIFLCNERMFLKKGYCSIIFILAGLLAAPAGAQRIESSKGNRVLITTDQLPFKVMQTWEILGNSGETTGEVLILQLRDEKAVGQIKVGFANPGFALRLKAAAPKEATRERRLFVGLSSLESKIDIKNTVNAVTGTAGLQGSQFGLQAGVDQILTERQLLRLRLGVDLVNTTGQINNPPGCNSLPDCKLWIHYFTGSLGFLFQARPYDSSWNIGMNTSFVTFIPVSKYSDSLDSGKITWDGGLELGAMVQFKINPITWIELSGQRMFLRTTDTLSMQFMRYNLTWMQYF